jgi:hypothetical protein
MMRQTLSARHPDAVPKCYSRRIGVWSTDRATTTEYFRDLRGRKRFRVHYHQQHLAKNPDGYFPNHSCGIPYRSAVSYSGEKA